jgi:hypothetical protein
MAVVLDHPVDDEGAEPIRGRPDFSDRRFGITEAKKYPPYVFGIRGVSCLVHKVLCVELHWWRCGGSRGEFLVKLKRPVMIAQTNCQQHFRLDPDIARTCRVPNPDALLCGRCHGEGATFGKRGPSKKEGLTRQEAHVKLGCVVQGY